MAYWDTSALLKLYVSEHDSLYFDRLADQTQEHIFSSAIVTIEVLCALYQKELTGNLRPRGAGLGLSKFAAHMSSGRIVTVPYGNEVAAEAETLVRRAFSQPRPIRIRSLDAIHVASALVAKAATLVATDTRLREVAALAGLKVLP